jgi:hypothetical protein
VVGVDQEDRPASAELLRLRAAAAAVADLDRPAHRGPADPAHDEIDDETDDETDDDAGFDATTHADRFSELHDALVTVLADVDRG